MPEDDKKLPQPMNRGNFESDPKCTDPDFELLTQSIEDGLGTRFRDMLRKHLDEGIDEESLCNILQAFSASMAKAMATVLQFMEDIMAERGIEDTRGSLIPAFLMEFIHLTGGVWVEATPNQDQLEMLLGQNLTCSGSGPKGSLH